VNTWIAGHVNAQIGHVNARIGGRERSDRHVNTEIGARERREADHARDGDAGRWSMHPGALEEERRDQWSD
jgi:hypothetical protein